MNRKAIIFGIRGTKLSADEKFFFKKQKPWGIILFSRNIKNLNQLKFLVSEVKNIFKDKNFPILIDQEGGKVSRLDQIIDFSLFSQEYFGNLYTSNKNIFLNNYKIYINTVSNILNSVGININTVPVLDIKRKNAHKIIGNRSFSKDPIVVSKLGRLCVELYKKNKIATVIKHIPGHGGAKSDSHFSTPTINDSKKKLIKYDFKPFKICNSFFAMTAHVKYKFYDSENVCTHSNIVINDVIRKHIKFKGIIISDDISMNALKFSLRTNTTKALDAGCNLILHCNANINEMIMLSKVVPNINKFTQKKTELFYKFLG